MSFTLLLRFAVRELRAGLSGFRILIACIAIGVAAIASVSTITRAITNGVAAQGGTLLGGDMAFSQVHVPLDAAQLAFVKSLGAVSTVETLRSMAHAPQGASQALIEIKAVDGAYPLTGQVVLESGQSLAKALQPDKDPLPIVVDRVLLAKLSLSIGDQLVIGRATFRIMDVITAEPDQVGGGVDFGPRVMMTPNALAETDLLQPGSLVRYSTRVNVQSGADEARLTALKAEATHRFPDAGWKIDTRIDARPGLGEALGRFKMFLSLVGLTSLVVGGVGVTNAVKSALDARMDSVATLKALGASGPFVVGVYLAHILLVTLIGITIGLGLGAIAPFVAAASLGSALGWPVEVTLNPLDFLSAFAYGLLTAFAFAIVVLGRAQDVPVSLLFRDRISGDQNWARWSYLVASGLCLAALSALAIFSSTDHLIAAIFVLAAAMVFALLYGIARAVMWTVARLPAVQSPSLRLALRNMHRPGGLTVSVVVSLGLGLTLLVTLALIDGNLRHQLTDALPQHAPSFFFVDVKSSDLPAFSSTIAQAAPDAKLAEVPMLRGRVIRINDIPAEEYQKRTDGGWVLQDERGITFSEDLPEGATLVSGAWWPKDYTGEPLVSFAADIAANLGLKEGDHVSVSVLGRPITARIANLRKVVWTSLGINFVMVFSPNAFSGAPYMTLATVTYPDGGDITHEMTLLRAVNLQFPTVTAVRVKDVLQTLNGLVEKLATAVRAAASIALISSILVLAGALAAGHQARIYDAVLLKVMGATRARILFAYVLEYALLGAATALFALVAGTVAAFAVIKQLMHFDPVFIPLVAFLTIFAGLSLTITFGLIGTLRALSAKAATVLRSL